jgi:hypothetical protein
VVNQLRKCLTEEVEPGGYRTSFPGGTHATASFYSGGSIPVTVGAGGAANPAAPGCTEASSRISQSVFSTYYISWWW